MTFVEFVDSDGPCPFVVLLVTAFAYDDEVVVVEECIVFAFDGEVWDLLTYGLETEQCLVLTFKLNN